ncbi:MAG: hypothetical protein JXA11_12670 [Phycisphaerae bacterium]|nr:hypothetical protein [Phycisphaerae bacterium]
MTSPNCITILAEGDFGISEIVFFVLVVIGSILSAYFKKAGEKRQQDKARQQAEEAKAILARKAQREQVRRVEAPPKHASLGTLIKKRASLRDFIQQRTVPPSPPTKTNAPARSMFAAAPKPVSAEEPRLVELEPIEHLPSGEEWIHSSSGRRTNRNAGRKKSVGELIRQPEDSGPSITEWEISDAIATTPHEQSTVHTRVNLLDPATARAAILFQEILSPPKALRDRAELWE